jgi:putative inorganic carbon (hco3(-)) transporter
LPARRVVAVELLVVAAGLALCAAAAATVAAGASEKTAIAASAALAIGLPVAYLVWHSDPAYPLAGAIALSPFSGNWSYMHIPGALAPDRWLLLFGVAAVLLRAPGARDRPKLRIEPVHWVLAVAALYAVSSAIATGTFTQSGPFFRLVETFGISPFLVFLVAPVVFRTTRQRDILIKALVGLGAYLSVLAVIEQASINSLVFPRYIQDPSVGIHFGQARGPFVDATLDGMAMYACAVAAAIAVMTWRSRRARLVAMGVCALCLFGTFLTMQRSVWVGASVATLGMLIVTREARRLVVPVLALVATGLIVAVVLVPSLSSQAQGVVHQQRTVTDRKDMYSTALNMVEARPLTGFGWSSFQSVGPDYFQQSPDYPKPATDYDLVHNIPLAYAGDLGLVGLLLWALGLTLAVGGALLSPAGGDLRLWRAGLVGVTALFGAIALFTPPSKPFPTLILMLWAGVVWGARYAEGDARSLVRRRPGALVPPRPVDPVAGAAGPTP